MLVRNSSEQIFMLDDSEESDGTSPDGPEPTSNGSLPKLGTPDSKESDRAACAASLARGGPSSSTAWVLLLGALAAAQLRRRRVAA